MSTTEEWVNKLKDQIKEILSEDTKKDIETEYVREKMGNTEARNTRVNICNSFKRTKDDKQEKWDICKKNGDQFPRVINKMRDLSLKGSKECQTGKVRKHLHLNLLETPNRQWHYPERM